MMNQADFSYISPAVRVKAVESKSQIRSKSDNSSNSSWLRRSRFELVTMQFTLMLVNIFFSTVYFTLYFFLILIRSDF